jgi:hypothetical protein
MCPQRGHVSAAPPGATLYDKSQIEQKKRSRLDGVVVGGAELAVLVDMASNLSEW